ncbi:MAG: RNB domain-containing ribonuclease, partial [Clostridiales bacterium]|nr:RNB domain-containing ribonuclease [Clostridiales bacterium]
RSMQKALYSTDCRGHFGLGLKYYCHFTSPIRRYPDLMIHRIIKESLAGPISPERTNALDAKTEDAAEASSQAERKALELEREVDKMKKAEYMASRVGEAYEGVVSGVTQYGLFVQLPNTVEGMVRADCLGDDYYNYEPDKYRLVGVSTKKTFSLGDKLKIVVKSADVAARTIDFTADFAATCRGSRIWESKIR